MRKLTAVELSRMQANQVESLMDTCVIQVYSETIDSYGQPTATYTDESAIDCGLNMNSGRENWRTDMTVTRIDATLRLPLETIIKSTDRVKVTHRFGAAITAIVFEVIGAIRRGPSGLSVDLLQVLP